MEKDVALSVDKNAVNVVCDANEVAVVVTSNRSWSLVPTSPCNWVEVSQSECINLSKATQQTEVVFTVSENLWIEQREAVFDILAGETAISLVLTQDGYVERNRVKVEVPVNSDRIVNPNVFSSLGGSRSFSVVSNCKWTASVSDETTATGVSISATSGYGDVDGFTVTVDGINTDLDKEKKVVIEFVPEGQPAYKYEMIQQKGSIIAIEARDMDNKKSVWPFVESQLPDGASKGTLHIGDWAFNYECTNYNKLHASGGWQFGSSSSNYIEFPAIEGRRLSRVTFYDYNDGANPFIAGRDITIVEGGEKITYKDKGQTRQEFKLPSTAYGTPYRIYIGTDKTFRFWLLEIEYVK